MHTGDVAIIDGQGYCSIVGRIKDMVRRCNYHSRCCVYSALALQWAALQPWPHGTHPNRSLLLRSPASLAGPHGWCCSFTLCALPRSSVVERMCTLERWRSLFTGTRQWQKCRQGGAGGAGSGRQPYIDVCSGKLRQRCVFRGAPSGACSHGCCRSMRLCQLRPYLSKKLVILSPFDPLQVFGVPDAKWGEELCAWVRLRRALAAGWSLGKVGSKWHLYSLPTRRLPW